MPRKLPEEMEGQKLVPVCLASRQSEAVQIESVLDGAGIDYTFEIAPVAGRSILSIIFGSIKKGVMFLVPEPDFEKAAGLLEGAGLSHLIIR